MRGSFLVACPFRFSAADIGEDSTHGPCDRADRHRRDWGGSDRAPPRMSSASLRSEANYPAAERSPRTRLCKKRVRCRLSGGGTWIRTSGSARKMGGSDITSARVPRQTGPVKRGIFRVSKPRIAVINDHLCLRGGQPWTPCPKRAWRMDL